MRVVLYQFEFAICLQPLSTVVKVGPPALMELFARGQPDEDGDMPEPNPAVITNVAPVKAIEVKPRDLLDQLQAEYPVRTKVLQDVWRDFGGDLPEEAEALDWFNPEQTFTREYDFFLRNGGTLEDWLAGERANAGDLLDINDEGNDDGEGSDAREPAG